MKRENFKKIIKLRSFWRIDRRRKNYTLPSGTKLKSYIFDLVYSQMELDNLGIASNGDLYTKLGGQWNTETKDFDDVNILIPFHENDVVSYEGHERRIERLVDEILFG